jgi:hypothetical protein
MLALAVALLVSDFRPGAPWVDTDGNAIQAHGGGVLLRNGTYYWYGENRTLGYNNKVGVSCYSSRDLTNWTNEGVVLPKSVLPEEFQDTGVCERPKVIYNRATGKYVMWMHLDAKGYAVSEAGVAVADTPTGPFRWHSRFRPVATSTYRDMNLFADDDGRAYAIYSGEENQTMHVVRLNSAFTAPERPMVEGKTWARIFVGQAREAPAPFKHKGRYYLVTSGCTGWDPNPAEVAVADHPLGPWKTLGNPCDGPEAKTTYRSQSTFVLPAPGKPGRFIYMGDRWERSDLANSRYIWLPMTVDGENVKIHYRDRWDLKTGW